MHRSLTLMQSPSPEYLERFVADVDALPWLEQANEAEALTDGFFADRRGGDRGA